MHRDRKNTPHAISTFRAILLGVALIAQSPRGCPAEPLAEPRILEAIEIEPVWAGHRVGFCLLTHGDHQLTKPLTKFPGLGVRWACDLADGRTRECRYVLRWESLGPNRDKLRSGPLPEPAMLAVYCLSPD